MFTANWDGIHDNETGLLGFSVAVGLSPCDNTVYKFHDPHGHLLDSSQWTYSVIMTPIPAPYTVLPGECQDNREMRYYIHIHVTGCENYLTYCGN